MKREPKASYTRKEPRGVFWSTTPIWDSKLSEADNKLIMAAGMGRIKDVQSALDSGANVNVKDHTGDGRTPLQWAASGDGHPNVVKLLLKSGADVDAPDARGVTVLMAVASSDNIEVAEILLDAGAKVNARDGSGHSAMWYAHQKRREGKDMEEFLESRGGIPY